MFSTGIANIVQQPSNQPPTFSGPFNPISLPPMSQSLPQLLADATQNAVPTGVPGINNHTVFLVGNGAERQCDLKFT